MNISKHIQILALILFPTCLLGMEHDTYTPVQPNLSAAVAFGIRAGIKENQKNFIIQIQNGGTVMVRIDPYKYGSAYNSRRNKNRDSNITEDMVGLLRPKYKIHININDVPMNSLEWLKQVLGTNDKATSLFLKKWLYTLSVHNSNIDYIRGSWFNSFENLETLDLAGNRIIGFDQNDFSLPISLQTLRLEGNNLETIPVTLFQQTLQWLEHLDLSNNRINQLNPMMFSGLVFLNLLNLSNNFIATLPANLFQSVGELFPFFSLNISLCNNPISNTWETVEMQELGFNKRCGNKIIFNRTSDGQSTPRETSLTL